MITKFVGIMNITPDSFFDGGRYNKNNTAFLHLEKLLKDGADIIDIGAESTRPNATPISSQEEKLRLKDILPQAISIVQKHNKKIWQKNLTKVEISLDSRNSETASWALGLGVDILNDVSGFVDLKMIKLAAQSNKKIVVMHNLGVPAEKTKIVDESLNIVQVLLDWMENKLINLQKNGVKKEQIIFDIGLGFGKNSAQSIKLLQEIDKLRDLDLPLFVGHSNKSFLDDLAIKNCQTREEKTNSISTYLISKNIEYLRVHNIAKENFS